MKQESTILVCCHKEDFFYGGEGYMPIHVGKAISKCDLGIACDNTGDNISEKNPNYCELTAHYWYWKNCKSTKYVGLNHYRRYFDFKNRYIHSCSMTKEELENNPPTLPDMNNIFRSYDIILTKPTIYHHSLKDDYARYHIAEDLATLKEVITELSPDYLKAYEKIIERGNRLSKCNMFITRSEIFDDYSKWCFEILGELERRVKISEDAYQARIFGYLSERMLNIYVCKHQLRVKYLPIIKVKERTCSNRVSAWIQQKCQILRNLKILGDIKKNLIFKISK